MSRVIFEDQRPGLVFDTGRADIACFVGLVRIAGGAEVPPVVLEWLKARGWAEGRYARDLSQLGDIPIPVESYTGFMAMFDSGGSSASSGTDYVAANVRSFFAQGGKRCYIVRMGDPVARTDSPSTKKTKLDSLLIGLLHDPSDPSTWHGTGHLAGLLDVSFLCLPDLPVLAASEPSGAVGQRPNPPSGPEQFVECSRTDLAPAQQRVFPLPAPRLSTADYFLWASSVAGVVEHLMSSGKGREPHLREIQFVASCPLPQDLDAAAATENPSSAELAQDIREVIKTYFPESLAPTASQFGPNLSSAFVQLAYPWLKTSGSNVLLESLEPPEGALAGVLARNALTRGTFTSATKIGPSEIVDVWPSLPAEETKSSSTPLIWNSSSNKPLIERLSLFGFSPGGLRLLSDVTMYPGEAYRSARVNRLVSVICRAARRLGEEIVFDSNGPAAWARFEIFLRQLMTCLWTQGAFDGTTARNAFSVRCDRSTMTQNDLDNGRLVAQVTFTAAATVEVIRVTLALQSGSTSPQEVAVTLGEAA
jgi:hypothetical protein